MFSWEIFHTRSRPILWNHLLWEMFWLHKSKNQLFIKWSGLLFHVDLRLYLIDWRVCTSPKGLVAEKADSCPMLLFGQVPSHHITFLHCVVVNFYSSFKAQIIGHPLQLTHHQLLSPSHKPCVCCPNLMTTHTLHCCNDPFWKLPFPWKRLWRTKYLIHPLILTAKHKAWYMLWTSSLGEEWHRQRYRIF